MFVYLVFEFEETAGDAIDSFAGYAYSSDALAKAHAKQLWGGSVRTAEVRDALPEGFMGAEA